MANGFTNGTRIQPVAIYNPDTGEWVSGGGGGGGGDASAANQVIGNASLASIDTNLGDVADTAWDGVTASASAIAVSKGLYALAALQGSLADAAWDGTGAPLSWGAVWKATALAALNSNPTPVALAQSKYEPVAASQTDQTLGATGAADDYLAQITIQPSSTSPGAVTIKDGSTTIYTWPGTSSFPAHLPPVIIPLGAKATGAGWKITTGANLSVLAVGEFT